MSNEDLMKWANTCMEFVYEDLGYKKEQVLHSTIHLDEKTPYIHCVVVPLVKKFDKRTNTERYTISKKQYIKDNIHLSELQDKCHKRLTDAGFELERGIKGSDSKNLKIKEFKKATRYYENKSKKLNEKMDCAINEFEEKMKTTKNIPFNKTHVLVEKETFDSMNNVINETKKVMEFQPKLEQLFDEVNSYTKSHQTLEKENKVLTNRVNNLTKENNTLKERLKSILKAIKTFFRQLLLIGNELTKAITTSEIKDYFDDKQFSVNDVYDISKETTKEDELFDYVGILSHYKTEKKNHNDKDKKDDFDLTL